MLTANIRNLLRGVALLLTSLVAISAADAADRYGGIEIGAKGIKVSAVEVDGDNVMVLSLDEKTVDVTISALKDQDFSEVKIEDVADVVANFKMALISELEVPQENISIVVSSGVPFADNLDDLVTAIQEKSGVEVAKIDAQEEATLAARASVPKERRENTLVIDVGSGNTKGGIFLINAGSPDEFVTIEVPFGTATLAKEIETRANADGKSREEMVQPVANEVVGTPLQEQLTNRPEAAERTKVLFSGGSVWAAMTILHPESALEPFPTISTEDIKAYVELLAATPGKYPEVDFSNVDNEEARAAAQADYDRIVGASGSQAVFSPEELQAGAAILNEVAESFNFESKTVYFDRTAVNSWLTAYITPEELRDHLPGALDRNLPEGETPEKPDTPPVKPTAKPTEEPPASKPAPKPAPLPATAFKSDTPDAPDAPPVKPTAKPTEVPPASKLAPKPAPLPATTFKSDTPDEPDAPKKPVVSTKPVAPADMPDKGDDVVVENGTLPPAKVIRVEVLEAPAGLSKPVVELLTELLFLPKNEANGSVVYTAEFCQEVSIKCYEQGRYQDALAFAKHAITARETPAALYLKGLSELALDLSDDVAGTAQQLKKAGGATADVIGPLRERLNGPRTVRLVKLVEAQR